eukprot:829410-Pelagomonas_calceolata.AAC.1
MPARSSCVHGMDACQNERVLEQGIEVPENNLVNPNGHGSPARRQSRPDAVFERSIPGRSAHIDPTNGE